MADTDRLQLENGDILQLEDGSGGLLIERTHLAATLSLVGQLPTVLVSTSIRLTQAGDLIASSSNPRIRLTQGGSLVLWRSTPLPVGQINLYGQTPRLWTTVSVPSSTITLIGLAPSLFFSTPDGLIQLVGQPITLASTVLVPSGLITLTGAPPTVTVSEATAVNVQLTQAGDLVLHAATDRNVQLTQAGDLVASSSDPHVDLSQAGDLVVASSDPHVNLTQAGILVLYYSGREIAPEIATNFGPLVWVEWTGSDGSLPVWAPVDLPDPSTYYRGFKISKLLTPGVVRRSLSDESGEVQNQRFDVEIDDCDRSLRTLLGLPDMRRQLVNTLMVVRMISDEDRRLLKVPRTVAIGIVRSYTLD